MKLNDICLFVSNLFVIYHSKYITVRNGLKMSPRKCKLFKKSLVFMGLTMMVEDGMAKMKPLKSRIEAILKVQPPTTVKE